MKKILFFLFIFFSLYGEQVSSEPDDSQKFDIDPLLHIMPLEPQHPMHLSISNQEKIFGNKAISKEIEKNKAILYEHSFPWLIVFLLLLTPFGWLLWNYYHPSFNKFLIRSETPKKIALTNLQDLEDNNYIKHGEYKTYYTKLIKIIRNFLENQYKLPIQSQTTEEFLHTIFNQNDFFSKNQQEALARILLWSDRVKFANYQSTPEECYQAYQDTLQFINKTF